MKPPTGLTPLQEFLDPIVTVIIFCAVLALVCVPIVVMIMWMPPQ